MRSRNRTRYESRKTSCRSWTAAWRILGRATGHCGNGRAAAARETTADLADRWAAVAQRYGGTVDKFTGDGIMAVFGAPAAWDDHAVRACLACVGRQEEAKRRRDQTLARSSMVSCQAPQAIWRTGFTVRRPRASTRSSCTSMAAATLWVTPSRRSAVPGPCLRGDAVVISTDYRHAPEHPFPAAVDDAMAAVQWVADNAQALGGRPGQLAVCGWSSGGGIATVVCQLARDMGGPNIMGQALLSPSTAGDVTRASFDENADGYGFTTPLVRWCYDHYIDVADRRDPRFAPLCAADLSGLPPAIVVTAEFDPCATTVTPTPGRSLRRASRPSRSVPAATPTSR